MELGKLFLDPSFWRAQKWLGAPPHNKAPRNPFTASENYAPRALALVACNLLGEVRSVFLAGRAGVPIGAQRRLAWPRRRAILNQPPWMDGWREGGREGGREWFD